MYVSIKENIRTEYAKEYGRDSDKDPPSQPSPFDEWMIKLAGMARGSTSFSDILCVANYFGLSHAQFMSLIDVVREFERGEKEKLDRTRNGS